ncbi:FAD-binding domain-containing protein [Thozetella sp. PMI_491]|nr:FAD-binding domain-containing protein [Thozetella sp. PMI_491]
MFASYHDETTSFKGVDASVLEIDAPVLLPLIRSSPGIDVFTQSSPHFGAITTYFIMQDDCIPLAVIRPKDEAGVVAIAKLCASAQIKLTVRSGGNDFGERSRIQNGIVLDLRSINFTTLAEDSQSVRIGGGTIIGPLIKFLDGKGLDTPTGWAPTVGYISWATAGGYGLQNRTKGLGVDQILGARVVTADGTVLQVSASEGDEDVWWAVRGGGNSGLGIITELTIKVYPKPHIIAGIIGFPLSEIEAVVGQLRELYTSSPDELTAEVFANNRRNNGGDAFILFWWEVRNKDGLEMGREYYRKICSFGTVVMDTHSQTKSSLLIRHLATPYQFLDTSGSIGSTRRLNFYYCTLCAPGYSAELGRILARYPFPTPASSFVIHVAHGRGAKEDVTSAFANRKPHILLGIGAICLAEDSELTKQIAEWPKMVYNDIVNAGLATDWKYRNFNPPEPGEGHMYFGKDGAERMQRLIHRLDPAGLQSRSAPDFNG